MFYCPRVTNGAGYVTTIDTRYTFELAAERERRCLSIHASLQSSVDSLVNVHDSNSDNYVKPKPSTTQ